MGALLVSTMLAVLGTMLSGSALIFMVTMASLSRPAGDPETPAEKESGHYPPGSAQLAGTGLVRGNHVPVPDPDLLRMENLDCVGRPLRLGNQGSHRVFQRRQTSGGILFRYDPGMVSSRVPIDDTHAGNVGLSVARGV